MPKPTRVNKKQRQKIVKKYRKDLDNPDLDIEIKDGIIKVSSYESELELFENQIKEMRDAQRQAVADSQEEIDKIQEEIRKIEGGIYVKEDEIVTRHYYLEDQGNGNGNGNGGN